MPDPHSQSDNSPNDPSSEESAQRPFNPDGGEDEASTSHDGQDDHLHEDQKPIEAAKSGSGSVEADDPKKTEKLTQAGRDIDPDEGGE